MKDSNTSEEIENYDVLFKKCIKELHPLTDKQRSDMIYKWYVNREIPFKMVDELTRVMRKWEYLLPIDREWWTGTRDKV